MRNTDLINYKGQSRTNVQIDLIADNITDKTQLCVISPWINTRCHFFVRVVSEKLETRSDWRNSKFSRSHTSFFS